MAAVMSKSGAVITAGSGKHRDKRDKRARTRSAAKRRALKEQE